MSHGRPVWLDVASALGKSITRGEHLSVLSESKYMSHGRVTSVTRCRNKSLKVAQKLTTAVLT